MSSQKLLRAFAERFLGNAPEWYKRTILGFLVLNPIVFAIDPYIAGWVLVIEFIFTLAMALSCYPLQPGGLLAFEAVVIGMTSPSAVYQETVNGFEVILLLVFMVAGVFFLKDLLLFTFTKLALGVRSKILLSLLFSGVAAALSAFLDALTVTAVVIAVATGFYGVYHRVASGKHFHHSDHDLSADAHLQDVHRADLVQFRAFLRSLVMHAAVGTALGGVTTLVAPARRPAARRGPHPGHPGIRAARYAPAPDSAASTMLYQAQLAGKRVLVLADDARDVAQVRPLLPPPGSALLVTTVAPLPCWACPSTTWPPSRLARRSSWCRQSARVLGTRTHRS